MKMMWRRTGVGVALLTCAATFCGCPPSGTAANVFGCSSLDLGFWSVQIYELDGTFVGVTGYLLNPDGTMAVYTDDADRVAGTWQRDCETVSLQFGEYTLIALLNDNKKLDGSVFDSADPNAPAYTAVLEFVGPAGAPLPRVTTGHWRFTFSYEGDEYKVGVKLNSDGTTEASPVGDSSLGPGIFWNLNRGKVFVGNADIQFNGLILSANRFEGSYFVDSPGRSEYGYFSARYVPGVVEADLPDDQAPLG